MSPEALYSVRNGADPQPTNSLPLASGWRLPMYSESKFEPWRVLAGERRGVRLLVELEHEPAGGRGRRDIGAAAVELAAMVVEQRDQRRAWVHHHVVLPLEVRAGADLEARVRPTERPLDLAGGDVDLVGGPRVAHRHDERPVAGHVDRVDVVGVPREPVGRESSRGSRSTGCDRARPSSAGACRCSGRIPGPRSRSARRCRRRRTATGPSGGSCSR